MIGNANTILVLGQLGPVTRRVLKKREESHFVTDYILHAALEFDFSSLKWVSLGMFIFMIIFFTKFSA